MYLSLQQYILSQISIQDIHTSYIDKVSVIIPS